jgi:hypothetical protein
MFAKFTKSKNSKNKTLNKSNVYIYYNKMVWNTSKMIEKYKESLPLEYFNQFRQDLLDYERGKTRRLTKVTDSLQSRAKQRDRDYVVKKGNRIRTCVFNNEHHDILRSGSVHSRNLKMRWWCNDCKCYFTAYEYEDEAKIAEEVRKQVQEERKK